MHPRAMKVQQNGHKCHVTIPSQKRENSENSINFVINSCSTNYVALSMVVITLHCLSTHTQNSQ